MWDVSGTYSCELSKSVGTIGGPPRLDPGTLGLKEGCIWSNWSGEVGIIRESKKTCPVVSDWSGGVGSVCGMKCEIFDNRSRSACGFTSGLRHSQSLGVISRSQFAPKIGLSVLVGFDCLGKTLDSWRGRYVL